MMSAKGEKRRERERERGSEGEASCTQKHTYNFLAVVALSYVLVVGDKEGVWHLVPTLERLIDPEGPTTPHLLVVRAKDGRVGDTIRHL